MILLKTAAGQQAFKERHGALSLRQRSAFLLFDGKRTLDQVLAATHSVGIGWDDVRSMIEAGLLELADKTSGHRSAKVPAPVDRVEAHEVAEEVAVGVVGSERSASERYQAGYLIATELTAALGLRGFRLHLAVEGATGLDSLVALAPKIREAVGADKYARLEQALFA